MQWVERWAGNVLSRNCATNEKSETDKAIAQVLDEAKSALNRVLESRIQKILEKYDGWFNMHFH